MPISPRPWREIFLALTRWRTLSLLLLGFSAGLPYLLVFSVLSLWLREAGIERSTLTLFSWAALAYSLKFLWAPLVDALPLPWLTRRLGRRRAWLLLAQSLVVLAIVAMANIDPAEHLAAMALAALLLAFAAATQDIVIDALRIELAGADWQALLSSAYIAGYRIGMIAAGAGALELAAWGGGALGSAMGAYEPGAWHFAYGVMAALMLIGILTTLSLPEPPSQQAPSLPITRERGSALSFLRSAFIAPFASFFQRHGAQALLMLAFISLYRAPDIIMGVSANIFYADLGFSKEAIAAVAKTFGLGMTLLGGFLGGALTLRVGVMRPLFWGALLSAASNLLFAGLAQLGANLPGFVVAVAADNLAGGLASAAFVAWLSGLTQRHATATQYALMSSLMTLLPKFLAGYSGAFVDAYGYVVFFIATAALGLPVLLLWVMLSVSAPRSP